MEKESSGRGTGSSHTPPPAAPSGPPVGSDYMDRWSRNLRLYETLKGMGLFVSPIPETDDPTKIRYMIVSADLPLLADSGDAGEPHDAARTGNGTSADNVIDFPNAG